VVLAEASSGRRGNGGLTNKHRRYGMAVATMRELLEAGVHFGHLTRRWNPKMERFIFGKRNRIYIIDLQKTMAQLHRAYLFIRGIAEEGKSVLFVGTKRQAQDAVREHTLRCSMFYVNQRWLGGTLTNFSTVKKSVRRMKTIHRMDEEGELDKLPKKEAQSLRKTALKLNRNLCGIADMEQLPAAVFIVDTKKEAIALREARKLKIPSVGIVDTNSDPDEVTYPIPGNDDAIRSINLFCRVAAEAVIDGRSRWEKVMQEAEEEKAAELASKVVEVEDTEKPESGAELAEVTPPDEKKTEEE
jgi:small subunit ribosomal protein S2